jgi:hypothetical protein
MFMTIATLKKESPDKEKVGVPDWAGITHIIFQRYRYRLF